LLQICSPLEDTFGVGQLKVVAMSKTYSAQMLHWLQQTHYLKAVVYVATACAMLGLPSIFLSSSFTMLLFRCWKMWRAAAIRTRLDAAVAAFQQLETDLNSDIKIAQQLEQQQLPALGSQASRALLLPGVALPASPTHGSRAALRLEKKVGQCWCHQHCCTKHAHASSTDTLLG
jgi:hypothetical protein